MSEFDGLKKGPNDHVHNYTCPECGRGWTGYASGDKVKDSMICKDCQPLVDKKKR